MTQQTVPVIPPGFSPLSIDSAYARGLGTLWADEAKARLGVTTTDALANIAGVVHGGALATLADIAMFVIAGQGRLATDAVTLTLNTAFVSPARLDRFIVASGRIVRAGRSIVFIDGEIRDADQVCLTFSGTLKRLKS